MFETTNQLELETNLANYVAPLINVSLIVLLVWFRWENLQENHECCPSNKG